MIGRRSVPTAPLLPPAARPAQDGPCHADNGRTPERRCMALHGADMPMGQGSSAAPYVASEQLQHDGMP